MSFLPVFNNSRKRFCKRKYLQTINSSKRNAYKDWTNSTYLVKNCTLKQCMVFHLINLKKNNIYANTFNCCSYSRQITLTDIQVETDSLTIQFFPDPEKYKCCNVNSNVNKCNHMFTTITQEAVISFC